MALYFCKDCEAIFSEPITVSTTYEDEYGISSLFAGSKTPMEYEQCPYCDSSDIDDADINDICLTNIKSHVDKEYEHLKKEGCSAEYLAVSECIKDYIDTVNLNFNEVHGYYYTELSKEDKILASVVEKFIELVGSLEKAYLMIESTDDKEFEETSILLDKAVEYILI